jgi:hypothetical protein
MEVDHQWQQESRDSMSTARSPDSPALILWSANGTRHREIDSMYEPMKSTLIAGVREYAGRRHFRFSHAIVHDNGIPQISHVANRGDMFIWLGEAGRNTVPWRNLRRRGVFSIYFQTEAWDNSCALYARDVDEMWDYSFHNIEECRNSNSTFSTKQNNTPPTLRWVPVAALHAKHQAGHPQQSPPLFFLGTVARAKSFARYWCIRHLLESLGHGRLKIRDNVWTEDEYAHLIQTHDIFLNIHKSCGDARSPLESFRLGKILNAGGIIISERAHPEDEKAYDGLVTFANVTGRANVTGIATAYWHVANLTSAERATLASERQRMFRDRFAPRRIFARAGIYELFDRHFDHSNRSSLR